MVVSPIRRKEGLVATERRGVRPAGNALRRLKTSENRRWGRLVEKINSWVLDS